MEENNGEVILRKGMKIVYTKALNQDVNTTVTKYITDIIHKDGHTYITLDGFNTIQVI